MEKIGKDIEQENWRFWVDFYSYYIPPRKVLVEKVIDSTEGFLISMLRDCRVTYDYIDDNTFLCFIRKDKKDYTTSNIGVGNLERNELLRIHISDYPHSSSAEIYTNNDEFNLLNRFTRDYDDCLETLYLNLTQVITKITKIKINYMFVYLIREREVV